MHDQCIKEKNKKGTQRDHQFAQNHIIIRTIFVSITGVEN